MKDVNDMGISVLKDNVIISFGARIDWIGLSKEDALKLAKTIKEYAEKIVVSEVG